MNKLYSGGLASLLTTALAGTLAGAVTSCNRDSGKDKSAAWAQGADTGGQPRETSLRDDYSSFLQPVTVNARRKKMKASSANPAANRKFSAQDITPIRVPNLYRDGILHIFYGTNSWMLQQNDLRDLARYARSRESRQSIIVEGYADHRGSESWNMELSGNRAEGVERYLRGIRPDIVVQTTAYGESKATADGKSARETQRDRVVRLLANQSVIRRGLDLLMADYYLVDQSSSMGEALPDGRRKWDEVQAYHFPEKAQVYTFTTADRAAHLPLSELSPTGSTPLYFSLYDLIQKSEIGKNITTLTDGADTERGPTPEDIIKEAQRNKLTLSFIMLGHHSEALMEIARVTGGKVYIGAVR